MHKCASTSIQALIAGSRSIDAVQFYDDKFSKARSIFNKYVNSNIDIEQDVLFLENFFADKSILSTESLCGQSYDIYSGFYLNCYPEKIKKVLKTVEQINIVLRDPVELLYSMYKNDIQMGVQLSVYSWLDLLKERNWIALIKPNLICDAYSEVCNNIKIFDFQDIIKLSGEELNNTFFNGGLLLGDESIGKKNKGQSFFSINIQRIFINQLFSTKHSKLHHYGKASAPMYNFFRYTLSEIIDNLFFSKSMEELAFNNFSKRANNIFHEEIEQFNQFLFAKKVIF
jgi:hypothetical protein